MRQPEEEHVADELGAEQAEGELDHPGDHECAEEADGLLAVLLLSGGHHQTLGRGGKIEANVTWLGHEEEEHDDAAAGDNGGGDHEAEGPVLS